MAPDQRDGTATTLRPGRVTPDEVWIRNLLDSSDEVIYFKDLLSRFVRVSHGCAALHGRTQEELYGLTDTDLFASEHAVKARVDEEEVIRTGRPILNMAERETWAGRPDTWVASSKFPLRDLDGTVIGTFGISRDITPRVLAEQETACMTQAMAVAYGELRRVESELRAVLNGTTDAIAQYDGDLRLRYLNPAAERLSGRCLADLVGLTDAEAGTDWTDLQEPALRRVLETGTPDEVEFELRAPGGETLWFHTTFSADRDAEIARRLSDLARTMPVHGS